MVIRHVRRELYYFRAYGTVYDKAGTFVVNTRPYATNRYYYRQELEMHKVFGTSRLGYVRDSTTVVPTGPFTKGQYERSQYYTVYGWSVRSYQLLERLRLVGTNVATTGPFTTRQVPG
jgi:hypothetical protein